MKPSAFGQLLELASSAYGLAIETKDPKSLNQLEGRVDIYWPKVAGCAACIALCLYSQYNIRFEYPGNDQDERLHWLNISTWVICGIDCTERGLCAADDRVAGVVRDSGTTYENMEDRAVIDR